MDVGSWLQNLGLEQYEALFRENDIDADVLGDLADADLEKLGVTLGHRKRLLKAIASLGATEPAGKPTSLAPLPLSTDAAERRPITVMFCDLAGSTGLAARLDAEDWRNLVNAYLDEASKAVTDFDGHVLKKLGDGLMALFGYPHAQENDAERAVRAALAIQRALADLNARNVRPGAHELSARIGIESGSVVVDAAGEVFGDAPNVAARVQSAAEPGTVLVTARLQRQTAGLFVVEDKGAHDLKGVPVPVALYRIVRASGGRRGGARILTPLVGREDELSQLQRRWSRALEGEGQFVQIVGEPGIGKSRLIEEFRAKLVETPHTWVEWAASQLLQNTPLHPLAEWGRLRFGGADATDEGRLADLENTLGLIGIDAAEYAPLLAPLVDIPLREERRAKLPPEEMRRRQLAAMTAWVLAGARTQPVVLAFEDLHWADPTSLDLMARLVERGAQSPLLVVATTRPEFRAPWAMRSHHGVVSLAPLDRAQVRRMVGEIANRHALSDETIDGVGERTGGVPLFVEEVTRLLLERDAQGGAQAIPPTLQQSLAARLDRLGEAREVAQIGAVLGRDFSYRLLSDVSSSAAGFDELRLQAGLDRLTEADLLFVDGAPPAAAYRFKHALIQDAAYDSLLKSRRQALHRRAAEALRDANAEPEAIAHHFTEAGLDDPAIEWWGKAGDQALRRSAFQEAIAHLGKAIAMADKVEGPETVQSAAFRSNRLRLQTTYGQALLWAHGHAAAETNTAFTRARALARQVENAAERFSAYYGLWVGAYTRGEIGAAQEMATLFLHEIEAQPHLPEACVGHRIFGTTRWYVGDFTGAHRHLATALGLYDRAAHGDFANRFGQDVGVSAGYFDALALFPLGHVDEAVRRVDQARSDAETAAHVPTLIQLHFWRFFLGVLRRRPDSVAADVQALSALVAQHNVNTFVGYATFADGWTKWALGERDLGMTRMLEGIEVSRGRGYRLCLPFYEAAVAEAEAQAGDVSAALGRLERALAEVEDTGERWCEPEMHRIRAEFLLKRDASNIAPAEKAFQTAIAIAKEQEARSFELRAALSLAKLYQSTGRPADAHAVLAPALEGFSPTPEMPEIEEAHALLATLAATDEVKADWARRQRQQRLHVAYGNALFAARGFGAPEATEAFVRARESASGDKDMPDRLAVDYGLWAGSYNRGELPSMRDQAAVFLNDLEAKPNSPEASVAHRAAGVTRWFAGEYREARDHLERALALFQPGRDDDLAFRFGLDPGVAAMGFLANVSWTLGEVDHAFSFNDRLHARMACVSHIGSRSWGTMAAALFELMRGDHARAAPKAFELARLAREHELIMYGAFGVFLEGWATTARSAPRDGLEDMRRGVELLREQNVLIFDGLLKIALAEAEARAGDPDRAVAILDEALATCDRMGHRAFEAELHRVRGEILLERDPANPAPTEEDLLAAIAIAKQQTTRSFELRAALSLANLYKMTRRPVEAHTVLASALEGFSQTPKMPELTEAQALLAALTETDEVRAQAAQQQRLTQLRVAYGNALLHGRGMSKSETTAAFARARALSGSITDSADRISIYYGLWVGPFIRGDLASMREAAETFLADAERRLDLKEAGVAHRLMGTTFWYCGDYLGARPHLDKALAGRDHDRDRGLLPAFGYVQGVPAKYYMGMTLWALGETDRGARLLDESLSLALQSEHIPTIALARHYMIVFSIIRREPDLGTTHADALLDLDLKHGLPNWRAFAKFHLAWVARRSDLEAIDEMRAALAFQRERDFLVELPLLGALLAETEAEAGELNVALDTINEQIALIERTGQRWYEPEANRIRGEILLKLDSANVSVAENALLNAVAIARGQGARTFGLRAALSLAKLYQSTDRAAEAHTVLAPALEGFSPRPEMHEITEAQALLVAIEAGAHVRHE